MRIILMLILSVFSLNLAAKGLELTCFSSGKVFFHKKVKDAYLSEGYVVAEDGNTTYFLSGECILKCPSKDLKK